MQDSIDVASDDWWWELLITWLRLGEVGSYLVITRNLWESCLPYGFGAWWCKGDFVKWFLVLGISLHSMKTYYNVNREGSRRLCCLRNNTAYPQPHSHLSLRHKTHQITHDTCFILCVLTSCLHILPALTAAARVTKKQRIHCPCTDTVVRVPWDRTLLPLSSVLWPVSCLRLRFFCSRIWRATVVSIIKNICCKPQYWTSKTALEWTYISF